MHEGFKYTGRYIATEVELCSDSISVALETENLILFQSRNPRIKKAANPETGKLCEVIKLLTSNVSMYFLHNRQPNITSSRVRQSMVRSRTWVSGRSVATFRRIVNIAAFY